MTNAKQLKNSSEYVEVNLSVDLVFHLPGRAADGKLVFRKFVPDEVFSGVKVKVPGSIAHDQKLLAKYVYEVMANHDADVVDITGVNIWEPEKDDFRFPC